MLTHERLTVTLYEVETHWSVVDLLEAHRALDVHDELQHLAYEKAKNA